MGGTIFFEHGEKLAFENNCSALETVHGRRLRGYCCMARKRAEKREPTAILMCWCCWTALLTMARRSGVV